MPLHRWSNRTLQPNSSTIKRQTFLHNLRWPWELVGLAGVLLLGSCAILLWGTLVAPDSAYDDAYITFRYADNLRHGQGLVYTPGEWVLGTTTPLFALLLGLTSAIHPDIVGLAHWISVAAWLVAVGAAAAFWWRLQRPRSAAIAGALVAVQPTLLASLGMETALVVALMLVSAWAWTAGRRAPAVISGALLILARPDATLWVIFLGLATWRGRRSFPWLEACGTVLLTLPWFVFAYARYGALLPNSALAKIGQTQAMAVQNEGTFTETLAGLLHGSLPQYVFALLLAAALAGVYAIARHERDLWWMPTWLLTYCAVFELMGVANFGWYFAPPILMLYLLAALGFGHLAGDKRLEPYAWQVAGKAELWQSIRAGIALLLAMLAIGSQAALAHGVYLERVAKLSQGKLHEYRQVGRWLAANSEEDALVASIEIGVVGYYSQRAILDTMGLISPAMRGHLSGWTDTLVYAVTNYWPDYAVVVRNTAWDAIVRQWWFRKHYQEATTIDQVSIYRRVSQPAGDQIPAGVTYGSGVTLDSLAFEGRQLEAGQPLDLWAKLRTGRLPPGRSYQFTLYLLHALTYERFATTTVWPYNDFNFYPSSHWAADDTLHLPFRLAVPGDLPAGAYRLGILLYDADLQEVVVPQGSGPDASGELFVGWLRHGDPPPVPPAEPATRAIAVNAEWDSRIRLQRIAVPPEPVPAGAVLSIDLIWKALAPTEHDWTVFLHLLDAQGEIVAQRDTRPFDGLFPTPTWQAGEVLVDRHPLPLPAHLPTGAYTLRIGLYDAGGRAPVSGPHAQEDSILLEAILAVEQPR
jgi:hypothetical protein